MTDPTAENKPVQGTTGWEKADSAVHGVGRVVHGTGWVLTKLWGAFLLIAAIIAMVAKPDTLIIPGLLVAAYGVYLLAPGSKFVVW